MTENVIGRPRGAAGAVAGGIRPLGIVALVGALGVTLVLGWWGLQESLAPHGAEGDPAVLTVPGGEIHVGGEQLDIMAHTTMPGMAIPDPLPDGERRFRVGLTLVGLSGSGLAYSEDMFSVSGPGVATIRPKPGPVREGVVPEGMSASIILLFQVPEDAVDLRLSVDGSSQSVALDRDVSQGTGEGHHEEDSEGQGVDGEAGDGHGHEH